LIADTDSPSKSFPASDPDSSGARSPDSSGGCRAGRPVLRSPPDSYALFLDVDGTLLAIADHPDGVHVSPDLLALLRRLNTRIGGALALVSGRAIANLDDLFAPLRLPCAGVHGLERRGADSVLHASGASRLLDPIRPALADFAETRDGVLLEDKEQSLAIHFRNAPARADEVEQFVTRLIVPEQGSLELKRGKMVLEVKPSGANKGTAITAFMEEPPFAGRVPVFVGDDVTDEDGFQVVNRLGGLSVRVGCDDHTAAPYGLPNEAAVHDWLRSWLAGEPKADEQREEPS
jgi:trehalose 6-phosphate phosphatase